VLGALRIHTIDPSFAAVMQITLGRFRRDQPLRKV